MASRTITDTAEELIPENALRKSLAIQNQDSTINVFVKKESPGATTVSTTDHDFRLGPDGTLALNSLIDGDEAIQSRFTIVAASGTPRISFFETESINRS